ncbi:hypothetical protein HMPREF9946_01547 [Acetobacteraceae bacterium AT-5844]|nr:hypothetical protein HMPREF9946_01547 [Acetobacteraceae bacterium AT-5844]
MIVVQSDEGFTVVELLGQEGECPKGASVVADWTALGSEPLFMGREEFDAYFQGTWGSVDDAISVARRTGGG